VDTKTTEHLERARWQKLVWNIPFSGLSVLLDATTKDLVEHQPTRQLAVQLMKEVIEGAAARGFTIEPSFVGEMLEATDRMIPYLPSLKVDFDKSIPMEIEAIFGTALREATAAGAQLPLLLMLYGQLCFIQRRLTAGLTR
jgi:2-dehydropantoate 2-reductase